MSIQDFESWLHHWMIFSQPQLLFNIKFFFIYLFVYEVVHYWVSRNHYHVYKISRHDTPISNAPKWKFAAFVLSRPQPSPMCGNWRHIYIYIHTYIYCSNQNNFLSLFFYFSFNIITAHLLTFFKFILLI